MNLNAIQDEQDEQEDEILERTGDWEDDKDVFQKKEDPKKTTDWENEKPKSGQSL